MRSCVTCTFTDILAVHNDFHQTHGIFALFDDLEVDNLDTAFEVIHTNGFVGVNGGNGAKLDGLENIPLANGAARH